MLKQKKAAFEMSITTIVILVIAMTMLVLGLVLVRSVFKGATENVLNINEKVKGEIDKLFGEEDQKYAVYLSQRKAVVKQGDDFGVAFAIKNIEREQKTFGYTTSMSDKGDCPTNENPNNWIILGKQVSGITLASGETYYGMIRFKPPRTTSLCMANFVVNINEEGRSYATFDFAVEIKPK